MLGRFRISDSPFILKGPSVAAVRSRLSSLTTAWWLLPVVLTVISIIFLVSPGSSYRLTRQNMPSTASHRTKMIISSSALLPTGSHTTSTTSPSNYNDNAVSTRLLATNTFFPDNINALPTSSLISDDDIDGQPLTLTRATAVPAGKTPPDEVDDQPAMAPLTKRELIDSVADELELPKSHVMKVFNAILAKITEAMMSGQRVNLSRFGAFNIRYREAHMARNPQSGEAINVPASFSPKFSFSKSIRDALKEKATENISD